MRAFVICVLALAFAACGSESPSSPSTGGTGGAGMAAAGSPGSGSGAGGVPSAGAAGGGMPAAGEGNAGNVSSSGGSSGNGGAEATAGGGAGGSGGNGGSPCETLRAGAHFLDSAAGDDAKDGTTPETAWKTLARANTATFGPGDALCLKAGGSWTGQLAPKGSGSASAPIVLDRYGAGALPRIDAGANDLQALLLENVQYWEVSHLELTNDKPQPGDYRGILVRGKDVGVLHHIYIRDSFVHDVSGEVKWIGGDAADDEAPWVKFEAGWDASKRTGGIVFEVASENGTKTWFEDVLLENNVIQDTSFGGIVFKQLDGGYGWGNRTSKTDTKFTPHENIVLRGNYLSQTNAKYGCNTVYVTGSRHVLIEKNVCKDSGTSAIEAYNSDDVVIQHNETFGTVKKAGGADSNGIDADRATTGAVIQYNYVHDNGDGVLLCQFAFGDSVVRYNLVVNNTRHGINLHSDEKTTNQTYNNLIFIAGLSSGDLLNSSGGSSYFSTPYAFKNNILSSTRTASVVATGSGISYDHNLFHGVAAQGANAQSGDPLFVDSSQRPKGDQGGPALAKLGGFQLKIGSLALEHGVTVANNGGTDFWGNALYQSSPDIGPFERP